MVYISLQKEAPDFETHFLPRRKDNRTYKFLSENSKITIPKRMEKIIEETKFLTPRPISALGIICSLSHPYIEMKGVDDYDF